jgi:hypothetical protein
MEEDETKTYSWTDEHPYLFLKSSNNHSVASKKRPLLSFLHPGTVSCALLVCDSPGMMQSWLPLILSRAL